MNLISVSYQSQKYLRKTLCKSQLGVGKVAKPHSFSVSVFNALSLSGCIRMYIVLLAMMDARSVLGVSITHILRE